MIYKITCNMIMREGAEKPGCMDDAGAFDADDELHTSVIQSQTNQFVSISPFASEDARQHPSQAHHVNRMCSDSNSKCGDRQEEFYDTN
jgi:hypothetical protein